MDSFQVVQPQVSTRPLGSPAAWLPIVAAADWRCECKGSCGRTHSRTEFRCDRQHDQAGVRLIVAPADLTLPAAVAAELPGDDLQAWCPACHRATERRQHEAADQRQRFESEPPATLF